MTVSWRAVETKKKALTPRCLMLVPLVFILSLYPPALVLLALGHLSRAALTAASTDGGLSPAASSGLLRAFSPTF